MKKKNKQSASSVGGNEEHSNKNESNAVTKIFIFLQSTVGIDRLDLCDDMNDKLKKFIRLYTVLLNLTLVGVTVAYLNLYNTNRVCDLTRAARQVLLYVLARISVHKMDLFLSEVHKGTVNVINTSVSKGCRLAWVLLAIGIITAIEVFLYAIMMRYIADWFLCLLFVIYEVAQIIELFLFGYLMNVIHNRIRVMQVHLDFIKETIDVKKNDTTDVPRVICKVSQKYFNEYLVEIVEFYSIGIQAMEQLSKIIQWPMIVLLVSNFITVLSTMYTITLLVIRNKMNFLMITSMLIRETIAISALFVPCLMCDRIAKGRHRLKLQLQHMLFSKALNDRGRRQIRSFLLLIEENDLSLTLLNLFDLHVGVPVNFLVLIMSYLIILLQFEQLLGF